MKEEMIKYGLHGRSEVSDFNYPFTRSYVSFSAYAPDAQPNSFAPSQLPFVSAFATRLRIPHTFSKFCHFFPGFLSFNHFICCCPSSPTLYLLMVAAACLGVQAEELSGHIHTLDISDGVVPLSEQFYRNRIYVENT